MAALAARDPRLTLARRVITRPADAGGEAFEGVDEATFAEKVARGAFALYWRAHGLQYGIPAVIDADLAAGRDVLANLSRAVLAAAHVRFSDVAVIALDADRAVLADRLAARGRETAAQIAKRLDRPAPVLPPEIRVHRIDNSGVLNETVTTILSRLYPVRV